MTRRHRLRALRMTSALGSVVLGATLLAAAMPSAALAQTTTTPATTAGTAARPAKPAAVKMAQAARPVRPASAAATATTLADALTMAYSTNTALLAERANLRATDENVPAALAGWRPQVSLSGNAGEIQGQTTTHVTVPRPLTTNSYALRGTNTEQLVVTQPLYRGGQTVAGTNRAENQVMGERARLLVQEQTTFANVVSAYVTVIQNGEVLQLNINNEQVLAKQLQATNDRFRVGEITRTDVAQAEAALAGATATRQTAEGNLQTARATYQQVVGVLPGTLVEPQPLRLPRPGGLQQPERGRRLVR
jgi:outer membrane protein